MLNKLLRRLFTKDNRISTEKKFVLLIDETGTDGVSGKISYVGCLMDKTDAAKLPTQIKSFNQSLLNNPRFSKNVGITDVNKGRHYVDDHFTVRELFFKDVIDKLPMRIYVVSGDYDKSNLESTKLKLMERLLIRAQATKRASNLEVIAEESGSAFQRQFPDVVFKDKSYVELSVPDYAAGGIREYYEILKAINNGGKIKEQISSFKVQFYLRIENMIAYEEDISTREIFGRRRRRASDALLEVLKS